MGEFTWAESADASRRDIARECLHWACTARIDGETSDKTIERAQAYFDWVIKQGVAPGPRPQPFPT